MYVRVSMVESVSVKVMCASVGTLGKEDRLGSFGVRARQMCSDSEEDSSFLLLRRREFNFCQTTACLIPLKGGRENNVITQIVLMAAILTI